MVFYGIINIRTFFHKDSGVAFGIYKLLFSIKKGPKPLRYFFVVCVEYVSAAHMEKSLLSVFAFYQTTRLGLFFKNLYIEIFL